MLLASSHISLGEHGCLRRLLHVPPCTRLLSAFHVAGVRLLFISRRASRRLARASSTAALVSGLSHHSGIRGIRLSVGSTVCAGSRIASVNPLAASGAVVFGWPVCSPRLCRNLSATCHRDISTCNSCRLNCRCFGLARMARLWGDSATEVDSSYYHVVVRVRFNRECGLGVCMYVWSSHIAEYGSTG